ncbi:hypothetical protein AB0I81_01320 [Nonomuraea sp. NPDC050404]|uniref:hypothetical protein n=1 Tax=Nonomuraea sp. NPDC050404 TaxID=3155783 RepID=UPI0033F5FD4F
MTYPTKKLLAALAGAALACTGVVAAVALPASAASASVQSAALFSGMGKGLDEGTALANAETAARQSALAHGFASCAVFESVSWQNSGSPAWFAVVTVRCEEAGR